MGVVFCAPVLSASSTSNFITCRHEPQKFRLDFEVDLDSRILRGKFFNKS